MIAPLLVLTALLAAPQSLVVFDVQKAIVEPTQDTVLRYDQLKFVASLQGLVNRDAPRLLIRLVPGERRGAPNNIDDYWMSTLREGWLKDATFTEIESFDALVQQFKEHIAGVVLWDPAVPATANVAATVCGVEGWLPVRAGGELYKRLCESGPMLPVKLSLVGKFTGAESGSPKCDAYRWAQREYLDTGRCNNAILAGFIDAYTQEPGKPGASYPDLLNAQLANHDYYIARRAFFFDLGPWHDEVSVDDPTQKPGADAEMLKSILKSIYTQNGGKAITTVGGFLAWNLKYTNFGPAGGKREPVPAEWEYATILSSYNCILDADALGSACVANISAWQHHPLKEHYPQNPRPAKQTLEAKTYVLFYMGDYDAGAWLSNAIPSIWDDPARGEIPLAWAFNPNLSERVPHAFDRVRTTATANDWFIAGDSGAGYLNPNLLTGDRLGSGLPDALALWGVHNERYYRQFDLSITGFVINGFHGDMPLAIQELYAKFSPDGVGMQLGFTKPLVGNTPFIRQTGDLYPDPNNIDAVANHANAHLKGNRPAFILFRLILQKPSTVKTLQERLLALHPDKEWVFCDPYTFFDLVRQHLAQGL